MKVKWLLIVFATLLLVVSCTEQRPAHEKKKERPIAKAIDRSRQYSPDFNADSAYHFIEKQVNFGPRVPNTDAHLACANFLEKQLRSYGFEVIVQKGKVTAYNGKKLNIRNIIGRYNPQNGNRIMLFAHWDTRPYADRDTENRMQPILGANDGGSGVGVLLEIARTIHATENKPNIGFDIIFFDAEDYGQPHESMIKNRGNTWCLGSQYWAKNQPVPGYNAKYGILLDMVGAKDAVFPRESHSMHYAPHVVSKVWDIASDLSYRNYFSNRKTFSGITDDHLYVNELAGIPSIDIVHYHPGKNDFGHFHHTHKDNMDIIDKSTLKAVGQTVMEVIYREDL